MFLFKKFAIAGALAVAVFGIIVAVMSMRRDSESSGPGPALPEGVISEGNDILPGFPAASPGNQNNRSSAIGQTPQQSPPVPRVVPSLEETEIMRAAKNFAERFGSYSSHANYAHAVAVMPLATPRMQGWLEDMIKANAVSDLSGVAFAGVTTRAVGSRIIERDQGAGMVSVEVDTQRIETGADEQRVVIQPIRIDLVKQDARWLVDGAFWGDIK